MVRFPSSLDGSSSVFFASLPKNLMLIAARSQIGRRRGIVITTVDPPS
jgi:hypothetical protein